MKLTGALNPKLCNRIFFLRFWTNVEDFLETTIKVSILKQITGYDRAEIV